MNLCCHPGASLVEGKESCTTQSPNGTSSAEVLAKNNTQVEEWQKEHNVVMKVPGNKTRGFECPNSLVPKSIEPHLSNYNVTADGLLKWRNNFTWTKDQFCIGYQENKSTALLQLTFRVCSEDSPSPNCRNHPTFGHSFIRISLSCSIFFLLLTVAFFVWYKNINAWHLNNMIKIAYLVNLTIAFSIR